MSGQWWTRINEFRMTARTAEGQWVPFHYLACSVCDGTSTDDKPCEHCESRGVMILRSGTA